MIESFEEVIKKVRRRESFTPVYKVIIFDLTAANAEEVLNIAGGHFQVIDGTDTIANFQIKFNENSNDAVTLRKGDAIITPFYKTFLSWTAQPGKTVTIAISADFDLWRIDRSAQIISTIDTITNPVTVITAAAVPIVSKPWLLDRAQAGQLFSAGYTVGASVGNYSYLQVWNPVGSGKTVIVVDAWADCAGVAAVANQLNLALYNTALATNIGNFANPNSGAAASSALLKQDLLAAATLGNLIAQIGLTAAGSIPQYVPEIFVVLSEGEGFLLSSSVVNSHIRTRLRLAEF